VLPFQNMSGDPEQEYFAGGVTEDIITALMVLCNRSELELRLQEQNPGCEAGGCRTWRAIPP
jgi:hypothetical protein